MRHDGDTSFFSSETSHVSTQYYGSTTHTAVRPWLPLADVLFYATTPVQLNANVGTDASMCAVSTPPRESNFDLHHG